MGLPEGLDSSRFERTLRLVGLRIATKECHKVLKSPKLASVVFKHRGLRNVLDDPEANPDRRVVLLSETVEPGREQECMPDESWLYVKELLASGASLVGHEVKMGYEHLCATDAIARLLPEGVEVPSGFETIGQIAHFNLRPVHEPYKELIGRIVLDKNKGLRTVVNKVGELSGEFRTFKMEVLAGESNFITAVREQGLTFELDYSEVYWNSRLSQERTRVLTQLRSGDIVVDMFAGIGAMSCFAASSGCRVLSNDLNPKGAEWMRVNVGKNRLDGQMTVFNMDAREFVRQLAREQLLFSRSRTAPVHVIMNLPALALDFLDVFRGICQEASESEPPKSPTKVHCYCFARSEGPGAYEEIRPRIIAALGLEPPGVQLVNVRDVAPHKFMYCVEFQIPENVLQDTSCKRRRLESSSDDQHL